MKIKTNYTDRFSLKRIAQYRFVRLGIVGIISAVIISGVAFTYSKISQAGAIAMEWGDGCKAEYIGGSNPYIDVTVDSNTGNSYCTIGNNDLGWTKANVKSFVFTGNSALIAPKRTYYTPEDSTLLFSGQINEADWYSNLTEFSVHPNAVIDTSQTINMDGMFQGMSSMTTLDLSDSSFNFDTSHVTSMVQMFAGMYNLETLILGPGFDTSNVQNMKYMFYTNVDVSNNQAKEDKLTTIVISTPLKIKGDNSGLEGTWCNGSDCYSSFTNGVTLPAGTYTRQDNTQPSYTEISKPSTNPSAIDFNDQEHTAPGYDSTTMDYSGTLKATKAGRYTVSVTPKSGYKWTGGTDEAVTINWTINRVQAPEPTCVPTGLTGTTGSALSTVSLSSCPGLSWTDSSQSISSGSHTYTAKYNPNPENYEDRTGIQITVTGVNPTPSYTEISKPSTNPSAIDFNDQEHTAPGYDSTTMDYSGTLKATKAGRYTVSVTPKSGYKWTGGTDEAVTINWTINRVQAPEPTNTPTGLTGFKGDAIGSVSLAAYPGFSWANGSDTIQLGSNQYDAIYNPNTENYTNRNITLTVTGVERTPEGTRISKPNTNPTAIEYDGTPKTVPGYNSSTMNVTGQSTATDIHDDYTATVTPKSGYIWTDGTSSGVTITWSIVKGTPTRPSDLKDKYEGIIGKPLSEITLPSSCVWEEEDTKVTAGTNAHYVNCNPDPTKYDNLRIQVNVEGVESQDPDGGDGQEKPGTDGDSQNGNKKANTPNTGVGGSASSFVKAVGSAFAIITPLVAITIVAVKKHHKKVDFTR